MAEREKTLEELMREAEERDRRDQDKWRLQEEKQDRRIDSALTSDTPSLQSKLTEVDRQPAPSTIDEKLSSPTAKLSEGQKNKVIDAASKKIVKDELGLEKPSYMSNEDYEAERRRISNELRERLSGINRKEAIIKAIQGLGQIYASTVHGVGSLNLKDPDLSSERSAEVSLMKAELDGLDRQYREGRLSQREYQNRRQKLLDDIQRKKEKTATDAQRKKEKKAEKEEARKYQEGKEQKRAEKKKTEKVQERKELSDVEDHEDRIDMLKDAVAALEGVDSWSDKKLRNQSSKNALSLVRAKMNLNMEDIDPEDLRDQLADLLRGEEKALDYVERARRRGEYTPTDDIVPYTKKEKKTEERSEVEDSLSEKDKQALKWARENPDDERAAKILKRLGVE